METQTNVQKMRCVIPSTLKSSSLAFFFMLFGEQLFRRPDILKRHRHHRFVPKRARKGVHVLDIEPRGRRFFQDG